MVCEATVTLCQSWGVRALEVPGSMHFTGLKLSFRSVESCTLVGGGQCGAHRSVMCAAGLHVRFWGGGVGVQVEAEAEGAGCLGLVQRALGLPTLGWQQWFSCRMS